ncbi:TetR/AcrR family transcriptional regulator [Sphingomonas naphthae]|uniref:TetR/AcrR family transcriptional regulator n=1 Tax=Sphingomonas naphthae TaxID=1813468 RepID=A0ABY7TKL8_9SPHN|nr:TetR/AcrR family transcriptional regulator [Sphingomonas naphthae]WCT73506.1 TetR/AcrR family transcriptional regulator [Sphingomonas naphthae]
MARTAPDIAPDAPPRPRGRPPLSEADVAARRTRIVEAAFHLFFTEGFTETTLEAVGKVAGVTKRTIYELIGDKTALFTAACDTLCTRGPTFSFDIPVKGRALRDVLAHMAQQLLDHSLRPDVIAIQRAVTTESTRCPEMVGTAMASGKTILFTAIAEIFTELVAERMISPLDCARAAAVFYDVAVGARGFRSAMGHPAEIILPEEIDIRLDMFIYGFLDRAACDPRLSETFAP